MKALGVSPAHRKIKWTLYHSDGEHGLRDIDMSYEQVLETLAGTREEFDTLPPGDISVLLWEKHPTVVEVEYHYEGDCIR